jgi:succinyl-CoA synthetase beta subunit
MTESISCYYSINNNNATDNMNLHEYQAKKLFSQYAIPVPDGATAGSADEALQVADQVGGEAWVAKAQVHAGGRGKGGGVKIVSSRDELKAFSRDLLGSQLITPQTGPEGLPVNRVLVEQTLGIDRELYLGLLVDRAKRRIVVMASAAGGMNIEEVAATTPEKIHTAHINPVTGMMPYQGRQLAFALDLEGKQIGQFVKILSGLSRLFIECDASLVEINPLVVTEEGQLMALDAKLNLDDNAIYRHPGLGEQRDESQEDERERIARQHDLNYISLDGNIACMVNGAGLAMATMDLIKLHGGEPANFLDVGGGTTADRVSEAFRLILSNTNVEAILVNIFGGIVRCDLIAEGIIQAIDNVHVEVPVVVRLEGTNVDQGRKMLAECDFDIISADGFDDAARKVVAAVSEKAS